MRRCANILISHLHGDHYFGLPGLLTSLALAGRKAPLTIHSPQHLRPRLNALLEFDRYDPGFPLHFQTLTATAPTTILSDQNTTVQAFPLQHRIPTNGFLIREAARPGNIDKALLKAHGIPWTAIADIKAGGDFTDQHGQTVPHAKLVRPAPPPRSFAYCSDTRFFPELASYVRGVDLLYHEATFLEDLREEALAKGHATARQAAETARVAAAKQLILGHFSSRYRSLNAHEAEARALFPNSHAARDLWQWEVPFVQRTTS